MPLRIRTSRSFTVLGVGVALTTCFIATTSVASEAPTAKSPWKVYKTPDPGKDLPGRYLADVSATSARSVWAVGRTSRGQIIARFNGRKWQESVLPRKIRTRTSLNQLYALTGKNVWAFGNNQSKCYECIWAVHRTGGKWRIAHIPRLPEGFFPTRVRAFGNKDFWAVGQDLNVQVPTGVRSNVAAAAHFDGTRWTEYPVPAPAGTLPNGWLYDIARVPGSNRWYAVGRETTVLTGDPHGVLNVEWTDATGFTRMKRQANDGQPSSLVVHSKNNAWAVGTQVVSVYDQPLIQHWNGKSWRVVRGARIGRATDDTVLLEIASGAKNKMVAVGHTTLDTGGTLAVAERYNGKKWVSAKPVNQSRGGTLQNHFYAVTDVPGSKHQYWAVGDHGIPAPIIEGGHGAQHTLAERCRC